MDSVIHAQQISFHRHGERVFVPTNVALMPGQLCLIRGQNGSGKTTLLRLLAGIVHPSEGSIARHGSVAFIGHRPGVKKDLTALDVLKFYAEFAGADPLYGAMSPQAALHAAGLARQARQRAGQLSAGQRQRLGLARLLVAPKTIWLLDEPYTSLDADGCAWVDGLLDQHLALNGSVAVAAHVYQPKLNAPTDVLDVQPGAQHA